MTTITVKQSKIHHWAANACILIFLFVTFFGTALPFQTSAEEIDEIRTSNVARQLFYGAIFLLSCFVLFKRKSEIFILIKKEKFLTLFLMWCFLSLGWSDFPFIAFKRLFQILTISMASAVFILEVESDYDKLIYFKFILYPYILLTFFSILFIPGAIDIKFGTWRGLATTKNHLGQIMLMCTVLSYLIYKFGLSRNEKIISSILLSISIIILFGTFSTTTIITFLILLACSIVIFVDDHLKLLGIGRLFIIMVAAAFLSIFFTVLLLGPELLSIIPETFGKDITFTGRTELWKYIIGEINEHLFLGTGFQSYWILENSKILALYEKFPWLPHQAHNGYIDIFNETGLVGLALFAGMITYYFIKFFTSNLNDDWKWFVIIILVINFQETTLFRPSHISFVLLIISYLTLFQGTRENYRE